MSSPAHLTAPTPAGDDRFVVATACNGSVGAVGADLPWAAMVSGLEVSPASDGRPFLRANSPRPSRGRFLLPRRVLVVLAAVLGVLMAGGAHGFLSSTHHGIGSSSTAAVSVPDSTARTLTSTATAAGQGGVGHDGQSGAHKHHMEEQGNRRSRVTALVAVIRSQRRTLQRLLLPQSRRWRPVLARGPPRWLTDAAAATRVRLHLAHCVFLV